jgi:hypothetical protein
MTLRPANLTDAAGPTDRDSANARLAYWGGFAALTLLLLAIVWFIWWYLAGSLPRQHTVEVDPNLVQQATMRAAGQHVAALARQPDPRGIRKVGDVDWLVNSTFGAINIRNAKDDYRLKLSYHMSALLPDPQQRQWLIVQRRLTMDDAMARQVGLSKDQVKQLRAIQPPAMLATDTDQQNLKKLWLAYISATGPAKQDAQKKLLDSFDDVAKSVLEPSKQAAQQRLDEIKAIVTPEMIAKLNSVARPPPAVTSTGSH